MSTSSTRKTALFKTLEELCEDFLREDLTEENFSKEISSVKLLLQNREKNFGKYLDSQKEILKEQLYEFRLIFSEAVKEYKEALNIIEQFFVDKEKKHIEEGLLKAASADKKVIYIQKTIDRKKSEEQEENLITTRKPVDTAIRIAQNIYIQSHIQSPYTIFTPKKPASSVAVTDDSKKKIVEDFVDVPIFDRLSLKDLEEIAPMVVCKKFSENSILFKENDSSKDVFIIRSGRVSIRKTIEMGADKKEEEELIIVGKGTVLGEMACIDEQRRSATAVAILGDVEAYIISPGNFMTLLEKFPSISIIMNKIFCHRVRETNERLIKYLQAQVLKIE
ncbi:MAG TPA: cyclic nucleotide-binding domain-containing protein [Candidatus Eremiobacteraeota bacterium]|nr:MAG: DNA-binding transcriptional dual regulator Crp [bacterium ADurb.Bin363]HPZ08264.1 cyclic nucleotide-binding domain-containing protein [Candidatus Eremiobacteraeota bacterium]